MQGTDVAFAAFDPEAHRPMIRRAAHQLSALVQQGRRDGWLEGTISETIVIETARTTSSLAALRERLGLSSTMEDVLWLLAAYDLDPRVRGLAHVLGDDSGLSSGTLVSAVYGGDLTTAMAELSSAGPLHRLELIEVSTAAGALSRRLVTARPRVVELAAGLVRLDVELDGLARLDDTPAERLPELAFASETHTQLRSVLRELRDGLTLLVGKIGTGRRSVLAAAIAAMGKRALTIDGRSLPRERAALRRLCRVIAREARLFDLVPLIRELDALQGDDLLAVLDAELDGPVFATSTQRVSRRWRRTPTIIDIADLQAAQRAAVWQKSLPDAAEGDAEILANLYPLTPALIRAVSDVARRRAGDEAMTPPHIAAGLDAVLDDRLAGLASRVSVSQTWDDLVLPDEQATALTELLARVRERRKVFETWGFADKIGRRVGTVALMSGPPGTGKTMAAGLVAASLHIALYRVDLSRIVSKWIGETEKNLAALFDAAEAGHVVLLFDEADALFGKRTDVQSSNDRHANQEVNYLLQRIEAFTGICLLTTNHDSAIDEAFKRRLSLHIRFTLPESSERRRLWETLLPAQAPVGDDLKLDHLAQKYVMSGGYIKNAVVRAAFLAADEDSPVTGELLERAAQLELEAMGRVVPRS